MRYLFLVLFLELFLNERTLAQQNIQLPKGFGPKITSGLEPFFSPSEGELDDLIKGEVIARGEVHSPSEKEQQLMLFVAGVHPRNCTRAMRKLSLYENFHNYMDFIKTSRYDERSKKFTFTIEHTLLPYDMVVGFKIPRIQEEGQYPFVFEDGFLKDLQGTVVVKELGKFCLLGLKADWRGPKSKIPDTIFSTFLQTVGRIGLEHLIRVSLF